MNTKEELIKYLEENKDTEYPFNEDAWKVAVEKTSEKQRKFTEIKTTDYDGNVKTKKIPNGSVNPVSKYFMLLSLPKFKIQCENLKAEENEDNSCDSIDVLLEEIENTEENMFIEELVSIYFTNAKDADLQFVIDRLSDYYSNYEFNEGSDKFLVVSAVSDELTLRELYSQRTRGKDNETKIDKVKKGYLNTLDGLKLLKKQGSKLDDGKNKFTMFVDDLEKNGELKITPKEITNDQVGQLVEDFRRSIVRAFKDG